MITLRNPATGEQVATDDPAPYVGWEEIGEGIPLADLQAALWERVKVIRSANLLTAETSLGTAQTDIESMVKINGLVSMAMLAQSAGAPYAETFTMADNSEVEMTAAQMIQFGVEVGQRIAAVHARGRDLRAAILAAASADALAAIDVEAGW